LGLELLNLAGRLFSEGRATRVPNISNKSGTSITRPSDSFTTSGVYAFTREPEKLHPDNRNIKAKIRQQLQELHDRNRWRLP
jgi:hypothetical protein